MGDMRADLVTDKLQPVWALRPCRDQAVGLSVRSEMADQIPALQSVQHSGLHWTTLLFDPSTKSCPQVLQSSERLHTRAVLMLEIYFHRQVVGGVESR